MPGRGRGRLILVALLQVVVTAGILAVVVWRFGLAPLVDAVTQLPWWAYPIGIALGAAGVVAQALRWRVVARHHAIRIPLGPAIARCWQASFLNSVLPGGLAGDALRAADDSSDADVSAGRRALASGFAAMAGERLAGTAVVFLAAGVALAPPAPLFALGSLGIAVLVSVIAWRWLRQLSARELVAVVALAVAGWAAFAGIFVVSTLALAPALSLSVLPGTAAVAIAGMSIPLGVGGWGTREAASAWAFDLAGSTAELGITVSIGYGILALASTLPGAVVVAVRVLPRAREVRRARERRRARASSENARGSEGELGAEVRAEGEAADRSAEGVGETILSVEADAGHAVADEHRRGGEVEPAEGVVAHEPRHRHSSALDQHP